MNQSEDLQQQVAELSKTVRDLSRRLDALEHRPAPVATVLPSISGTAHATAHVGPREKSVTVNPGARWATAIGGFIALFLGAVSGWLVFLGFLAIVLALVWPWTKKVTITQATTAAPTVAGVPPALNHTPAAPRKPTQFEQDLAKHWFSWLGIISLVVGITLLLNYAFQGLGPIGRVLTGYCAAGMLFGLWFWMRKMYQGFAFVLQSGAWAVVYISTFALHVIEGKPVADGVNAGILLLIVSAIITAAALLQKSKTLTVGAFFLGYITAFTNDVSLFTLTALLLLSVGAVAVSTIQAWPEFVVAATVATYAVQFAWMMSQSGLGSVAGTAAGYLVLEVLLFGAAHWLIASRSAWHRQMVTIGTVANLVGFYWLFHWMVDLTSNTNGWLATIFIGIVCGLLAGATALTTSRRYLRPVYIVFAIVFVTLGLAQKLHGDSLTIAYLIESAAVVCIGALMHERTMRYTGYAVSFLALTSLLAVLAAHPTSFGTTNIHSRLILGLFGGLLMGLNAAVLRSQRSVLPSMERYTPHIFADAGLAIFLILFGQELPDAWVPVVWSLMAVALALYGIERRSLNARIVGYTISVFTAFYWLSTVAGSTAMAGTINIHARLLAGAWVVAMYIVSAFLVRLRKNQLAKDESFVDAAYGWSAVIMLAIVLGVEVPGRLLSIAWGVEGVLLYIIGFASQSIQARRQGLLLLGMTIIKVYLFDVQTLATPFKILSFIILGVILLGVGFLYNRWRQQPKPPVTS